AQLAQSCLGCHGEFGISTSDTIPNLKGQNKEYLEYALQTYKTRERKGGLSTLMYGHARGLSEQDIRDVTLYYSSQK
ncbi:cytochrome c, partial [Vibrio breoganii]